MFTAVLPPEDVVEDLDAFLAPRREDPAGAALRWTRPETWHLTLGFMPAVPDRVREDLDARLLRAARRRTPFPLRLAGAGCFPDPARARLLYAAVDAEPEAAEELRRLSVGARAAAGKAGAPAQGGPFRPHLTLARSGRPAEATRWLRTLAGLGSRTWTVRELVLVASHLGQGPRNSPRYDVVGVYPLGRERVAGRETHR